MNKKVLLLILDGWGISEDKNASAIARAKTPYIDSLYVKYPHARLLTDGLHVGLPDGQMGNSEVGHMNLGAGRIIFQELTKINEAVRNNSFSKKTVLTDAFAYAKKEDKNIHFIGLVSDGGVHSHTDHLKGLLEAAQKEGLKNIFVHAFTDGRDVDPYSGKKYIEDLEKHLKNTTGKLASVIGRYYAMDRDNRWDRTKKAYDLLVYGKGKSSSVASETIQEYYDKGITDEFMEPIVLTENQEPIATFQKDDVVIFFNFRTDRGRQLTQVLTQKDFPEIPMQKLDLYFVTMTNYDETFKNIRVIFEKQNTADTLGEILSKNGKTQIRIAETEKYPHVTFFFSGGREEPFEGEKRILCPSPQVTTYDLHPEMSAYDLRDKIIPEIRNKTADFICLNFANPDMVGHTGVMTAAIKACETVDICTQGIVEAALESGYATLLIADHGNCEKMINPDGSPNTAHTTNPVPVIIADPEIKEIKDGILANIAPTVLKLMGIKKPEIMNQDFLI